MIVWASTATSGSSTWNENSYSATAYVTIPGWYSSHARPGLSRRARRLLAALEREGRTKLELRLRREEANRKAASDAKSRRRTPPVAGAPPGERHLQTYDDAMAARMAARRVA